VLSSPDRYLAGRVAEHHFATTVHILDDGFQHLQLDRDIDLVIVAGDDLEAGARTLPGGRLREPPDTLLAADAVLAADDRVLTLGPQPRHAPFEMFRMRRAMGEVQGIPAFDQGAPSFAVAGTARPQEFFDGLRTGGHAVVGTRAFRDHYRYARRDVQRIVADARAAGAARVLTTEKDYVRLLPFRPFAMPIGWVPLTMEPDLLPEFCRWLASSLAGARDLWPNPVD
jgi:tetraacyldisaccharide 4'-kinase